MALSELIRSLSEHCQQQVAGRHILAISDSSEINLQAHSGRLKPKGLGVVGNNRDVGFFIHPTLVLDAANGFPLGLSAVQLWSRAADRPKIKERGGYKALPIEEKESFKWLASANRTQHGLSLGGAKVVTHVGDREADLYEEWATVPDPCNHVLVRVRQDRRLLGQSKSLYAYLEEQEWLGKTTLSIEDEPRVGRVGRDARLVVCCAPVKIQCPENLTGLDYPPSIDLYAIDVQEIHVPWGQTPIHWRLLTTHTVTSFEQALQILEWYKWRWRIEQLFAVLKSAGLDLEATQLESVEAIQRLTILALSVAVRVLQMLEGRDNCQIAASVTFTREQQECLQRLSPSLEGRTDKQRNPYPHDSLPWATWIIARLAGWSGYQSQRPPGTTTLFNGLQEFEAIFIGWKLAQGRLVCTQ